MVAGRLAEGEGFEPPEPCGSPVFKTGALNHSATPPEDERQIIEIASPNTSSYFAGLQTLPANRISPDSLARIRNKNG